MKKSKFNNFYNEFELKYSLNQDNLIIIKQNINKIFDISFISKNIYNDTYYDTDSMILLLSGFSCRRRIIMDKKKEKIEIKFQPKKKSQIQYFRKEWCLFDGRIRKNTDFSIIKKFFLNEFNFTISKIIPILQIISEREKYNFNYKNNLYELSFDISNANYLLQEKSPIKFIELEIELISENNDNYLDEINEIIQKEFSLEISEDNKLEKSLILLNAHPLKKEKLNYDIEKTCGEIIPIILNYYFEKALQNLYGSKIGIDPEYIHDMRVALRKFRSALQVFRWTTSLKNYNFLYNNSKYIAQTLGNVRDLDIFLLKIENYFLDTHKTNKDFINILEKTMQKYKKYYSKLISKLFISKRFTNFVNNCKILFKQPFIRKDYKSISSIKINDYIHIYMKNIIRKIIKNSYKIIENIEKVSDEKIHKLRILFKKFRYSLEFFFPILSRIYSENKSYNDLIKLLPDIQDLFGEYVDTSFITDYCIKLKENPYFTNYTELLQLLIDNIELHKKELRMNIKQELKNFIDSDTFKNFYIVFYNNQEEKKV